jgi:hypothetical protein
MANGLRTQGTEVFFVDTVTASQEALVQMTCPTGVQGLGGARDQIEDTCLDNTEEKTFVAGLGNPGDVTIPFVFNPQASSHELLFSLKAAGDVLSWCVALSDGSADPTLNTDEGLDPPANRSSFLFSGFVKDVNIDIATNEVVRGTLIVQRSGAVTFTAA